MELEQKEFKTKKQLVIVANLEILQIITGLIVGLILSFSFNLNVQYLGIIVIIIFVILTIISILEPAFLRIIFLAIGILIGIAIYFLINIPNFIPALRV